METSEPGSPSRPILFGCIGQMLGPLLNSQSKYAPVAAPSAPPAAAPRATSAGLNGTFAPTEAASAKPAPPAAVVAPKNAPAAGSRDAPSISISRVCREPGQPNRSSRRYRRTCQINVAGSSVASLPPWRSPGFGIRGPLKTQPIHRARRTLHRIRMMVRGRSPSRTEFRAK